MISDLEVVPRQVVEYRGTTLEEMDLGAVLQRQPQVALVDELAHTNVPGSGRNGKRWQDVLDLLAAGVDVITTVNIQHLEAKVAQALTNFFRTDNLTALRELARAGVAGGSSSPAAART